MFWCVSFRLGAFGTVSVLHETSCKTCQTGAINVKVRATKLCHNFFATNTHDPHYWTLNSCFDAFLFVRVLLDHFSTARNLVQKRQTGAINAKVHATMSR